MRGWECRADVSCIKKWQENRNLKSNFHYESRVMLLTYNVHADTFLAMLFDAGNENKNEKTKFQRKKIKKNCFVFNIYFSLSRISGLSVNVFRTFSHFFSSLFVAFVSTRITQWSKSIWQSVCWAWAVRNVIWQTTTDDNDDDDDDEGESDGSECGFIDVCQSR